MPVNTDRNSRTNPPESRPFRNIPLIWIWLIILLNLLLFRSPRYPEAPYSEFINQVEAGNVERVVIASDRIQYDLKVAQPDRQLTDQEPTNQEPTNQEPTNQKTATPEKPSSLCLFLPMQSYPNFCGNTMWNLQPCHRVDQIGGVFCWLGWYRRCSSCFCGGGL